MHEMDKITLGMELERAFKINVPNNTAKSWLTIQHVIQYVRRDKMRHATHILEESKRRRQNNPKTKKQQKNPPLCGENITVLKHPFSSF